MAEVRIGCSGWHYKHWLGNFYPAKLPASKMLAHYYAHFDSVEINNSFYMLPKPETLRAWRDATPEGFLFACKGSRFITHNKKLKDPETTLPNLMPRLEILGEKLGPVLFQLPPKWNVNLERFEEFLTALPRGHRYTFEFRETSWLKPETYELLRRFNAAFCVYELDRYHSPIEVTADFVYIRLHGPGGKYQGSYSKQKLEEWAKRISEWRSRGIDVFIYFDNDQAGYAAANALELKKLLGTTRKPRAA